MLRIGIALVHTLVGGLVLVGCSGQPRPPSTPEGSAPDVSAPAQDTAVRIPPHLLYLALAAPRVLIGRLTVEQGGQYGILAVEMAGTRIRVVRSAGYGEERISRLAGQCAVLMVEGRTLEERKGMLMDVEFQLLRTADDQRVLTPEEWRCVRTIRCDSDLATTAAPSDAVFALLKAAARVDTRDAVWQSVVSSSDDTLILRLLAAADRTQVEWETGWSHRGPGADRCENVIQWLAAATEASMHLEPQLLGRPFTPFALVKTHRCVAGMLLYRLRQQ